MIRLRGLLLSTVALSAFLVAAEHPAHAQLAVFDSASFGQLVNEAQNGARQLEQMEQEVSISENQLKSLEDFYSTFNHLTNVTQLSSVLLQQGTIHSLPEMADLENTLRGSGFTGTLASQAQAMLAKVQYYHPTGTDFTAQQMNTQALATAGQMATAETLYSSNTQRINGLQTLMTNLGSSTDPKTTADYTARLGIENGYSQAQTNQILAVGVMQKAQADAAQQQAAQAWRQGADNLVEQATAAAGGAGS